MRNPLSKVITEIEPSGIRKFFDIVSEMKDAISLGVGEPDFDTPWHIRDEGIYSLEKGRTFYTSNAGLKELKIEISNFLNRKYGLDYDYNHEIMVTVGGSEAIDIAMRAMLDPGDEVLIPQPSYVSYLPCARLAGGVPVVIELKAENQFRLTRDELEAAITPKTKILVLPFPNNPTGAVMERSDLEELVDVIVANDLYVITDEIYSELTYTEEGHVSIAAMPGMKGPYHLYQWSVQIPCDDRMAYRICLRTAGNLKADAEDPSVCYYVCTDNQPVCRCFRTEKRG